MNTSRNHQRGFTIVELLIVVVVIAILAAITIVSYNGISNRAKESAAQSATVQVGKKVVQESIKNAETYPVDKDAFLTSTGVSESSDTTYDYIVSADRKNFCTTVIKQGISYGYSSTSGAAVKGRCVMNLIANPSANGIPSQFYSVAGNNYAPSTRGIATDRFRTGPTSLRNNVTGTGQLSVMGRPSAPFLVKAGESLSWSYWIYSSKAGNATDLAEGNRVSDGVYTNSGGPASVSTISIPANVWTKFTRTWQAPDDIRISQVGFYNLQVVAGDALWFDDLTVQRGTTLYKFADGNGTGYWESTPDGSASVNIVEQE
jgi:prepilin-type N-terminal cleavage/methylation domain-containing protein